MNPKTPREAVGEEVPAALLLRAQDRLDERYEKLLARLATQARYATLVVAALLAFFGWQTRRDFLRVAEDAARDETRSLLQLNDSGSTVRRDMRRAVGNAAALTVIVDEERPRERGEDAREAPGLPVDALQIEAIWDLARDARSSDQDFARALEALRILLARGVVRETDVDALLRDVQSRAGASPHRISTALLGAPGRSAHAAALRVLGSRAEPELIEAAIRVTRRAGGTEAVPALAAAIQGKLPVDVRVEALIALATVDVENALVRRALDSAGIADLAVPSRKLLELAATVLVRTDPGIGGDVPDSYFALRDAAFQATARAAADGLFLCRYDRESASSSRSMAAGAGYLGSGCVNWRDPSGITRSITNRYHLGTLFSAAEPESRANLVRFFCVHREPYDGCEASLRVTLGRSAEMSVQTPDGKVSRLTGRASRGVELTLRADGVFPSDEIAVDFVDDGNVRRRGILVAWKGDVSRADIDWLGGGLVAMEP